MEHIPTIPGCKTPDIRVPFLCKERYDGLEFTTYPVRKGWTGNAHDSLRLSERAREEQDAFLQTWLYFGMLETILGLRVDMGHFVRDGYISTLYLEDYMKRWYEIMKAATEEERLQRHMVGQACLKDARSRCLILLDETRIDCPLTPETRLAIRLLGESLSNAQVHIWESLVGHQPHGREDIRGKWGYEWLLVERMLAQNWCPNEVFLLQHYPPAASNSGMYCISSLSRSKNDDHKYCSEKICKFSQPEVKNYQQKHCPVGQSWCEGNCGIISPSSSEIETILAKGGIPLLRGTLLGTGQMTVDIIEYVPGTRYIAVSHVWSDGLGNPLTNSLLSCQLAFLIRSISAAALHTGDLSTLVSPFPSQKQVALFWIDTICVPVDPRNHRAKNMALDRMYATYHNAARVLVFDRALYSKSVSDVTECCLELLCSNWTRRLWTLQEGILGSGKLLVLFKDHILDLWKAIENLHNQQTSKPWIGHPILSFTCRTSLWRVAKSDGVKRISWLYRDFKWRYTSKATDEALIFANLTGLDMHSLLKVQPEDRMKQVFSQLQMVPRRIIFAPGERFEEEGYRWALKSFLNSSNFTLGAAPTEAEEASIESSPDGSLTLTCRFPGFVLGHATMPICGSRFFLFDTDLEQWMDVRKFHNFGVVAQEDSKMQAHARYHEKQAALIIHHELQSDRHTFGALIRLDRSQAQHPLTDRLTLSGTHEGAFQVFVIDTQDVEKFPEVPTLHTEQTVHKQHWRLR